MSKLRHQTLPVKVNRQGTPLCLTLPSGYVTVEKILECWKDTGCWWQGESEKQFYRLLGQNGLLCEIYRDLKSQEWFLYKIYD
jgi:hypothetical protein